MSIWAVVEHGQALQAIERASREPLGTEVLLDVTHAGVCHSDLHFWKGYYDMGGGKLMKLAERGVVLPRAPGHEVVGRISKLGPQAQGLKLGQLCIVYPWLGCGQCDVCSSGQDNLCMKPNAIGVLQDGGFGQQVSVPHPRFLVDVGAIDPAFAATLACSGITVYSAIKKVMPLRPDEPVVLFGAGGLGLASMTFRPRTIQGSVTGAPSDLRDVVALAQSGKLRPIPITRMPKAQANQALHLVEEGRVSGRIVLES